MEVNKHELIGVVVAIPMFFIAFLMFVYVMISGSILHMIFVNLMIIGGCFVIHRTRVYRSKVENHVDFSAL